MAALGVLVKAAKVKLSCYTLLSFLDSRLKIPKGLVFMGIPVLLTPVQLFYMNLCFVL